MTKPQRTIMLAAIVMLLAGNLVVQTTQPAEAGGGAAGDGDPYIVKLIPWDNLRYFRVWSDGQLDPLQRSDTDCAYSVSGPIGPVEYPFPVVDGGARGADTLAEEIAEGVGLPIKVFPADWKNLGRAAGPIRNEQIVEYADYVLAFYDGNITGGTKNSVNHAIAKGKKYKEIFL